ncbi:MAG: hypothetical protein ACTIA3_12455 [Corynebacterium casei]|uniref:Uncharacterized protein n=2 Tax=Corynebacterium casei TaxID=160386 RepID=G7HZ62_9CORY|nr:hypothetical protein [Corynebacterium casei]AHI20621.1 hypothetical protein CCASEI_10330 [Corynebacterium casei LMG S-19264]MDN5706643.1 hypothetical protein [Corynebacterium casei]MDN5729050.1 hypothetical protein [Corynebacterium casei]MDN5740421.1 hypothetical protein [Corynebacterium casei]MDN5784423.1 hypothetical protein [Corynebacterium casei]
MSNVEKKGHVSPNWPVTDRDHAITEIVAPFTGPSSPWGDDTVLPLPQEKLNYVHPYTRINR